MTIRRTVIAAALLAFAAASSTAQPDEIAAALYRTRLTAAEALYRLNQIGDARSMLRDVPAASRGWEWDILDARTDRSASTFEPHRAAVTALAVSNDGRLVASGSEDSTIALVDAASGALLATLRGHTGRVTTLDFSPDDKLLLSGSSDKSLRLWDPSAGTQVSIFTGEFKQGIYQAVFSRDGSTIGAGSWERSAGGGPPVQGFVKVLDARTGTLIRRIDTDGHPAASVAFSPDGAKLISGTWGFHVKRHDIASGATDWDHDLSALPYYTAVQSVDVSRNGRHVVESGKDNRIRLLDAASGTLVYAIEPWQGHKEWVNCVRFSPDGLRFASAGDDGLLLVWETATGALLRTFRGHEGGVSKIAWHPGGATVYSASADSSVKSWRLDRAGDLSFRACETGPWSAPASPAGDLIAVAGSDRDFHLSDLATGGIALRLDSAVGTAAAFSSDGRIVALGSGKNLIAYDAESGRRIFTASGHTGTIYGLAYHGAGRLFASAGDRSVRLWHASDGAAAGEVHMASPAYAVQFTPDGSSMVVGCTDGMVRFYSTATWRQSDSLRSGSTILSMGVSADGAHLVTGGDKGESYAWNLRTKTLAFPLRGHTNWVYGVALHPSLPYAVTASYDRTARVWDLSTGVCMLTLRGFTDALYTASIVRGGKRLVLTQVDGTVHVIDI